MSLRFIPHRITILYLGTMSSLQELEAAAINVIRILQSVPEFQNDTIAVIGGMALWK